MPKSEVADDGAEIDGAAGAEITFTVTAADAALVAPVCGSICRAVSVCEPRVIVAVSCQLPVASTVVVQVVAPSVTVTVFPATPVPLTVTDWPEVAGAEIVGAAGVAYTVTTST